MFPGLLLEEAGGGGKLGNIILVCVACEVPLGGFGGWYGGDLCVGRVNVGTVSWSSSGGKVTVPGLVGELAMEELSLGGDTSDSLVGNRETDSSGLAISQSSQVGGP